MPVKKLADAKQLPWKPRWSAHCTKERVNARKGRKKVSQLYDHMCHLCGKLFPDVQSKEEHSDQHLTYLGEGKVRCNQCNTIHPTGKPIYRHFLTKHTGYGFHCLVDGCTVAKSDKKVIIDHHYVDHKLDEYTKVAPRFKCETEFIRRLAGVSDDGTDPDPSGKLAKLLQPQVALRRIPDDELLFYLNFPEILGIPNGIQKVVNNYAFTPIKNPEGNIVVPIDGEKAPFIKVLMTQDLANSLPQVLHQIPGLVDESVEPLIPLQNKEAFITMHDLNKCITSLQDDNEEVCVKEVHDIRILDPADSSSSVVPMEGNTDTDDTDSQGNTDSETSGPQFSDQTPGMNFCDLDEFGAPIIVETVIADMFTSTG